MTISKTDSTPPVRDDVRLSNPRANSRAGNFRLYHYRGYDGVVLSTTGRTALKAFNYQQLYRQELAVYRRFLERQFFQANEFQIPQLVGHDDTLSVIEMTIVSPTFIVDFASVIKLDTPPQFDAEIMREARLEQKENFEADWPKVKRAISKLEIVGVYLSDVHPGNVRCH